MSERTLRLGAMCHGTRSATIWARVREHFIESGTPLEFMLFSSYELMVDALFERAVDIIWNSPLSHAWCEQRSEGACQIVGFRDVDLDYSSRLVTRRGAGITGLEEVRGKRLAVAGIRSAEARILPLYFLQQAGISPQRDLTLLDVEQRAAELGADLTAEQRVLRAVASGLADAGALSQGGWLRAQDQGNPDAAAVQEFWVSPRYDHCCFTALPDLSAERVQRWTETLLKMDYNADPRWKEAMDLEGLKAWKPGRKGGYTALVAALGPGMYAPI